MDLRICTGMACAGWSHQPWSDAPKVGDWFMNPSNHRDRYWTDISIVIIYHLLMYIYIYQLSVSINKYIYIYISVTVSVSIYIYICAVYPRTTDLDLQNFEVVPKPSRSRSEAVPKPFRSRSEAPLRCCARQRHISVDPSKCTSTHVAKSWPPHICLEISKVMGAPHYHGVPPVIQEMDDHLSETHGDLGNPHCKNPPFDLIGA